MVEVEKKVQRYDAYKDSGVEWLGEIPEHWEITRLANIGRFSSSGIDKLIKKNESLVKIINYTDVYKNLELIINSAINFMEVTTPESNRIKNLVKKGDLIFLPSSETLEDLGLSALVDEDIENLSFSYHVLRFEFTAELAHRFKKYFTNNKKVLNEFSKKGTGSIRKTLGRNDFRNTIVTLPSLQEQTAIAQFLDDKTTKIDAAIAIKKQQINLLKERKQILIHKAVTQGLNPNVKLKDSGVEWIGEIPEHWEVKKLTYLTKFITCGLASTPTYVDSKIGKPFLSAQNVRPFKMNYKKFNHIPIRLHKQLTAKRKIEKGDLLLTRVGAGIGDIAIFNENIDCAVYVSLTHIRVLNSVYNSFIMYFLGSHGAKLMHEEGTILAGGQGNLNVNNLRKYRFPLPPYQEQKEISTYIETASQKIETAISLKQQEIAKLKEYKSSLINSVVTGKLKVC